MFVDTVYEPLRRHGAKCAVLCAWGICTDGRRVLLGLETGESESAEAYLMLLRDLVARGLRTPMSVTTDGAAGLTSAVDKIFPRSLRIRCWFHKMKNLQSKVAKEVWPEFKEMVKQVRDATDREQAKRALDKVLECYQAAYSSACTCLLEDLEASLNHLQVLRIHQVHVRTTNLIERAFEEQRRRDKIIPHFVDERSILKLVFSVLIRVSQRWARRTFSAFEQQKVIQMRARVLQEPVVESPVKVQTKRRSVGHVAV